MEFLKQLNFAQMSFNRKQYTDRAAFQVGRVTPCAPRSALGRAAGRGLPALPWITGSGARVALLLLATLALTGCKGIPTRGEREARQQIGTVKAAYRPNDRRPALPDLTTDSSLSDFLTYAMLNQPQIEAAYYDWTASVENITVTRSLPDPQLTFQMDIANIVTSVMPGFMQQFPGPGKLRAQARSATAGS